MHGNGDVYGNLSFLVAVKEERDQRVDLAPILYFNNVDYVSTVVPRCSRMSLASVRKIAEQLTSSFFKDRISFAL